MKLHLPIMMALFAVANYAQADERLAFSLGDTDCTLTEGATWDASELKLTVEDVAFSTVGIKDYTNFSISFSANISEIKSDYAQLLIIKDGGSNNGDTDGKYPGQSAGETGTMRFVCSKKYTSSTSSTSSTSPLLRTPQEPPAGGPGSSYVEVPEGKLATNFMEAESEASILSSMGANLVDKTLIYGEHTFTLVFEDEYVTVYSNNEASDYNQLFKTTFYSNNANGLSFFEKITTQTFPNGELEEQLEYAGFDITFIKGATNIAFYNGDITKPIPEPTTATLGLMALAGLMARRRRASR